MVRFALAASEKLEVTNAFIADAAVLYLKLWRASGYEDQDAHLEAAGSNDDFLDYAGLGRSA